MLVGRVRDFRSYTNPESRAAEDPVRVRAEIDCIDGVIDEDFSAKHELSKDRICNEHPWESRQ